MSLDVVIDFDGVTAGASVCYLLFFFIKVFVTSLFALPVMFSD